MKKLNWKIWSITLLTITLGVTCLNNAVNAEESTYIATEFITHDIKEYAKQNFFNTLNATLTFEKNDTNSVLDFELGEPFRLLDKDSDLESFYFPVKKDGNIIYTYVLSKDENAKIFGQMSKFLAEELQEISDKVESDIDNPIVLYSEKGNIYYAFNKERHLIYESPMSPKKEHEEVTDLDLDIFSESIADISEDEEFSVPIMSRANVSSDANHVMIDFKITETQGEQPWCAAFAAAGILRNKKNPIAPSAYGIMKMTFPKLTEKQLSEQSISNQQLQEFANKNGSYPNNQWGRLSNGQVRQQLKNSSAVYAGSYGSGVYQGGRHAWDIFGWVSYGPGIDVYYVWNPWNTFPSTIDASTGILNVPGGSWTWDSSMSGW